MKGVVIMEIIETLIRSAYAYNVANTSGERPPIGLGPNWDDYWKFFQSAILWGRNVRSVDVF